MPDRRASLYTVLTALFVTCLLVADMTGGKFFRLQLFSIGGYEFVTHSVGMLAFPITFLLTDLVNEYYGPQAARRLTWTGLACALLAFLLIFVDRKLPVAPESPLSQDQFEAVFAMSNRLYVASLSAYVLGQLADIALFGALKRVTGGKLVWLRATGSTVVSQALDSFVVTFILFWGVADQTGREPDLQAVLRIAATGYILKFVLALGLTPLIYLGRWLLRTQLGMQPFEPQASPNA